MITRLSPVLKQWMRQSANDLNKRWHDEHWVAIQLFKSENGIERSWRRKIHKCNDAWDVKGGAQSTCQEPTVHLRGNTKGLNNHFKSSLTPIWWLDFTSWTVWCLSTFTGGNMCTSHAWSHQWPRPTGQICQHFAHSCTWADLESAQCKQPYLTGAVWGLSALLRDTSSASHPLSKSGSLRDGCDAHTAYFGRGLVCFNGHNGQSSGKCSARPQCEWISFLARLETVLATGSGRNNNFRSVKRTKLERATRPNRHSDCGQKQAEHSLPF